MSHESTIQKLQDMRSTLSRDQTDVLLSATPGGALDALEQQVTGLYRAVDALAYVLIGVLEAQAQPERFEPAAVQYAGAQ